MDLNAKRLALLLRIAEATHQRDLAALVAPNARMNALRQEMVQLRDDASTHQGADDPSADVSISNGIAQAQWQSWVERKSQDLSNAMQRIEPELNALRTVAGRSMGKVDGIKKLQEQERQTQRYRSEQRAERDALPKAPRASSV